MQAERPAFCIGFQEFEKTPLPKKRRISARRYELLLAFFALTGDGRLSRCEAGKWDTEWRARDIVEANGIIEHDGGWVAAGLTADTD